MPALWNHTIDNLYCTGYGRCSRESVWIVSAVQHERRVVFFSCAIMDEHTDRKRRYRVDLIVCTDFLDVLAESAREAEEIAESTDESLFHEVEDDGQFEVHELDDDEPFYPLADESHAES